MEVSSLLSTALPSKGSIMDHAALLDTFCYSYPPTLPPTLLETASIITHSHSTDCPKWQEIAPQLSTIAVTVLPFSSP